MFVVCGSGLVVLRYGSVPLLCMSGALCVLVDVILFRRGAAYGWGSGEGGLGRWVRGFCVRVVLGSLV